jgi:hypothetical protein
MNAYVWRLAAGAAAAGVGAGNPESGQHQSDSRTLSD